MFAWCFGPWLVRAGAGHLMLISPPGDIAALSRHPGDVYVRFCWVQLSGARVRDCREIAASSVTDLWMAMEFDQVSNKWTDFIRRLSQNYFIWRVNILNSKRTMMRGGVASLCHASSVTLTKFLKLRQRMMYILRTRDKYCVRRFKLSLSHPRCC